MPVRRELLVWIVMLVAKDSNAGKDSNAVKDCNAGKDSS